MKLLHLSDLHLGKRVNGYSMLEDQRHILEQILSIADQEAPLAVLLCGDLYDKGVPPTEAVQLFDQFLVALSQRNIRVFAISGNHDSPERVSFGAQLMVGSGVHFAPVFNNTLQPYVLSDSFGPVYFWLLPFIKPAQVHRFYPELPIESYTDALHAVISHMELDTSQRNVLLTHQFVTSAQRSESEDASIGGLDNVDGWVFEPFDYVALGHLHRPQNVGQEALRYCGTPLKYSFSEVRDEKSVTIVELGEKGNLSVRTRPLTPLHDLRELRGSYEELTLLENYQGTNTSDYLRIILTDEEEIPSAIGRLRNIYPNIMRLSYDNTRTRHMGQALSSPLSQAKSQLGWLQDFYQDRNGQPMSQEQLDYCRELITSIQEGRA